MINISSILVLAPHTDDFELGCGGFINKAIRFNCDVTVVNFSNAWQSLPSGYDKNTLIDESKKAALTLGLKKEQVIQLEYEVREFSSSRQAILNELINLRDTISPELVLMPASDDIHQDHSCITSEAKRAFKNLTCLGYELPWNSFNFSNTFYCSLDEDSLQMKIKALGQYNSQKHKPYFEPEFIRANSKVRGIQAGCQYAECFEVMRMYWR